MSSARPGLCAIVLAGGRSKRFGSDKASALLRGRPLLEWVVRAALEVCEKVIVVRAKGQELPAIEASRPFAVSEDIQEGLGPLAGIIAGMRACDAPRCLVSSCDAPLLQPPLVEYLDSLAGLRMADVILPIANGHPQPLLAIYHREAALSVFEAALAGGDLKINRIVEGLRTLRVDEEYLLAHDPGLNSFRNCNTPADLAELESRLT